MPLDLHSIEKYHKEKLNKFGFSKLVDVINVLSGLNPYDSEKERMKYKMFKEQLLINMPIMYISSIWVYLYACKNNCDTILFATRDCCQFYRIFKMLFPHKKCFYFNCSRIMFESATAEKNTYFREYVDSMITDPTKALFVDIHGTGCRMGSYFKKEYGKIPHCIILSSRFKDDRDYEKKMRKYLDTDRAISLVFDSAGSPIEMLNYDLVGTLQKYNEDGPMRDKLEYEYDLINTYHKATDLFLEYLKFIKMPEIFIQKLSLNE